MLTITIPAVEKWDETNEVFIYDDACTLQLEHSLLAISKWEMKWKKSFLSQNMLTLEESADYIRCMTMNSNVPENVYDNLSDKNIQDVSEYISASLTATTFKKDHRPKRNSEEVTSELIYYWMTILNIPFECENWHLSRLMALIRICDIKNAPSKKMSEREILKQNRALNQARRRKAHSKG